MWSHVLFSVVGAIYSEIKDGIRNTVSEFDDGDFRFVDRNSANFELEDTDLMEHDGVFLLYFSPFGSLWKSPFSYNLIEWFESECWITENCQYFSWE
jgi:hypothetical protein